jgi:hypothetical protein
MRVIIKPAGAIIVTGMVVSLALLAVGKVRSGAAVAAAPAEVSAAESASAPSSEGAAEDRTVFVNLTSTGGSDWVHWGEHGTKSATRKAGVGRFIGDLETVGGAPKAITSQMRGFSWSNGSPETKGDRSRAGLQIDGAGHGFHLTAPAEVNKTRTLRVYVGGYRAGGVFKAALSDGSAPDRIDSASVAGAGGNFVRLYTIRYKASTPGQKLDVNWTMGGGNGGVSIQAAAIE